VSVAAVGEAGSTGPVGLLSLLLFVVVPASSTSAAGSRRRRNRLHPKKRRAAAMMSAMTPPMATPMMPPTLCANGVPPPPLVPSVPAEVDITVIVEPVAVTTTVERKTDAVAVTVCALEEDADRDVLGNDEVDREELDNAVQRL
jgi:hypothetical protein